jgi:hypothetical protein
LPVVDGLLVRLSLAEKDSDEDADVFNFEVDNAVNTAEESVIFMASS